MNQNTYLTKPNLFTGIVLAFLFAASNVQAEITEANAEETVKNAPCLDGKSIEAALSEKFKMRSQRDLGWQVFNENGQIEVERAFLMNKSMQLRFRWRVNADGSVAPVSERAQSLCAAESAQLDESTVEKLVKNAPCLNGTIEDALKKSPCTLAV